MRVSVSERVRVVVVRTRVLLLAPLSDTTTTTVNLEILMSCRSLRYTCSALLNDTVVVPAVSSGLMGGWNDLIGFIYRLVDGFLFGLMERCMRLKDGLMNGFMNTCINGWEDGCLLGWIE